LIYRLECHLNVAGVSGARHESFGSHGEAEAAFADQLGKGRTQMIPRSAPLQHVLFEEL
jgi:hypothetical protein